MTRPNYATLLPVEIWRECFMLLGITEHKKLAKTCSFFHDICLAFIFKSITFSSQISFYKNGETQEMLAQLTKLTVNIDRFNELAKSPQYAPLVHKCTLRYSLRVSASTDESIANLGKDAYEPFVQAFVKCIPAFVNLREVDIDFTKKMDKRILGVLATLPQLERLSLTSVRFGVHQLKSIIKVKELSINNSFGSDCNPNKTAKRLDIFSAEHLERLSVLSEAYAPKIFVALTNRGPSKNLTRLSFQLNSKDMAVLSPFLATCPNVESIHLDFGRHRGANRISFPPLARSTIPLLQCFTGPYSALKVFIPERPVKKVALEQYISSSRDHDYAGMENMIPYLSRSTGPVIDLDIDGMKCSPELMALISTRLPTLTRLKLVMGNKRMFPEEDPHSIPLDLVRANEPVPHEAGNTVSPSTDVKFPSYAHAVYMSLMHWTVLGRINLPPNLKTLYLFDDFYFVFSGKRSNNESRRANSKPYTPAMAKSIFVALSVHYPALQKVVIGDDDEGMEWIKDTAGKWSWLKRRQQDG